MMRSWIPKSGDTAPPSAWLEINAEGIVLGRLASFVATRLRGKHKPHFTPHADCGDHVIIVNAHKVALTGNKREKKVYYRHTGYPGGIKEETAGSLLEGAHPERLILRAVTRMMPKGPLARQQLRHLHVYADAAHPHSAQNPDTLDIAALNSKNTLAQS